MHNEWFEWNCRRGQNSIVPESLIFIKGWTELPRQALFNRITDNTQCPTYVLSLSWSNQKLVRIRHYKRSKRRNAPSVHKYKMNWIGWMRGEIKLIGKQTIHTTTFAYVKARWIRILNKRCSNWILYEHV